MNGLVLEGGGARGSYHVGAVKALRRRHINIDVVVGTSIGSINGAFVASKDYKKLENLWKGATSKELFGIDQNLIDSFKKKNITKDNIKSGLKTVYNIVKNSGIDVNILKKVLVDNIDEDKLRKSNIDFGLVTYNVSKGKPVQIFKSDIPKGKLVEYLIASSYLPVFKFEKIIDENFYIDGGIFDRCPVDMILDKNLDDIYVVRSYLNKLPRYKTNARIIEIMPYKKLGSLLSFDNDTTKQNFLLGYYDALRAIDTLDGGKYYFKYKNELYYKSLFENNKRKRLLKKYNKNSLLINEKKIIINTLESIMDFYNLKRFKVYNIGFLTVELKIINLLKKDSIYSEFIKEMKVKF